MDFTQESETVIEALGANLPTLVGERKAEFILALYPGEPALAASAKPPAAKKEDRRGPPRGANSPRKFTPGRRR